jgi:hypothetical protein
MSDDFAVYAAWDYLGPLHQGWVVVHKPSGMRGWTGLGMTAMEMARRILERLDGAGTKREQNVGENDPNFGRN